MRRILLGAAMAAMLAGTGLGPLPVWAQGNPFQPLIYVNDGAVTRYELDQRVRFMEVLRAPETGAEAAEKALIEDRLRMFAARQLGITPNEEQIDAGLAEFAGRANLSVDEFTAALAKAGVERQAFRDFITAGVVWREIVRQRLVGQVRVTDAEIDQEMQKIIETPQVTHVALSEVIIPAPEGREAAAMAQAEQIVAGTRSEGDFAAFARRFSATPSAGNGGRLPWTPLANLPPSLRPLILSMQPGQVSQPLTVPGAVVLFFLRDTRGTLRPGAEQQVLDYVRFTLASTAEANRIAAVSDTCADLFVHARGLPAQQIEHLNLPQGQVPTGEAIRLAVLDENETSIVSYGGAVQLLMLCKRSPALLANPPEAPVATAPGEEPAQPDPNALPERDEVRNMIFNRKVGQAADAYMAELRANAVIRRP
ncbi:peptidylprolyl isomerase [Paracoccus sp. (in: a-proteobacteria)]|uniref:peptidylprolyl isomerase n=1 Tax=Paracoccus sp. TaxID=267 RepID=UPI0035AFD433